MAYRILGWCITVAAFVLLSACKKAGQPAPPSAPPQTTGAQSTQAQVTAKPAEPSVLLQMKWPAGNRYVCRMDLEQHSTNSSAQLPKPTREDLTFGVTYSLSVLKENQAGEREVEVEILATEMEIQLSGKLALHFDSTEKTADKAQERIALPFRKILGSRLRLSMDSAGKVDKVIGYKEWAENVSGPNPARLEQMLIQHFNEGFFRQLADFGRGLPAKPVQAGESWPYKTELPAGGLGTITLDSTITLKRWEDQAGRHLAVLESRGTLKSTPAENAGATGRLAIDRGTVAGTSWFDPELGTPIESSVSQWMELKGEAPAADAEHKAPVEVTSDIGQNVTVKLVESHASQPASQPAAQ